MGGGILLISIFLFCITIRNYGISTIVNISVSSPINILSAFLGIYITLYFSRLICLIDMLKYLKNIFILFGQYSLVILCFHIIELQAIDFNKIYICFGLNMPLDIFVFVCRVIFLLLFIYITKRDRELKKIFNLED